MLMFYLQMVEDDQQSAFTELYNEYKGLMHHVAMEILHHEQDAEDAVSQAFVNIAENMSMVEQSVSPKTKSLVITITERRAIDIYRDKTKNLEVPYNDETMGLEINYEGDNPVARCIAKLPANYREFVSLKYHQGFDNKEISKILKTTEANVRKMEQRTRERLSELCKKENIFI